MSLSISTAQYLAKLGISTSAGTFGLFGTGDPGGVNTLTWTWPAGLVSGILAGTVVYNRLTLQRSTVASYRPVDGVVVYDVGSNTVPAADANWTNVRSWNYAAFQTDPAAYAGSGWPDTSNAPTAYRLILNFAKLNDPVVPPFGEMCWNVRLMIPSQTVTVKSDGTQPRLTWSAPDVSWYPS